MYTYIMNVILNTIFLTAIESYLDPTMNGFDRSLLHEYEEWATIQPGFTYHGLNTYAYLLDRYGKYPIKSDNRKSGIHTSTVLA